MCLLTDLTYLLMISWEHWGKYFKTSTLQFLKIVGDVLDYAHCIVSLATFPNNKIHKKKKGKENRHLFRQGHTAPARGSLAVGWTAFKNRHRLTDCTRAPPGGCGRYTRARVSSWGWSYVTVYFFWGTRRQKDNQLNQSCLNLLSLKALEISIWQKGPAMAPITGRFLKLSATSPGFHQRTALYIMRGLTCHITLTQVITTHSMTSEQPPSTDKMQLKDSGNC